MGIKRKLHHALSMVLIFAMLFSVGTPVGAKAKVRLSKTKITIYVGKSTKLSVKGAKKKITWKSKNKKIATVNKSGKVTGKKQGNTKVTAKVTGKTLTCKVTVKKKKVEGNLVSTTPEQSPTQNNTPSNTPEMTKTPDVTKEPGTTATPDVTKEPGTTDEPVVTEEPVTPTEAPTQEPESLTPVFSKDSGEYDGAFDLTIKAKEGSKIYYTTDGSIPTVPGATENPGPTEAPGPTEEPVSGDQYVSLATANTEYNTGVTCTEVTEGDSITSKIVFSNTGDRICYKLPANCTDLSNYKALEIKMYVGAPIAGSTSCNYIIGLLKGAAVDASNSGRIANWYPSYTEDQTGEVKTITYDLENLTENDRPIDLTSCRSIMFRTHTDSNYASETIIKSIRLVAKDSQGMTGNTAGLGNGNTNSESIASKTLTYGSSIPVVDRNGMANVLACMANVSLMYNGTDRQAYYPTDAEVAKATVIRAIAVDTDGTISDVVTKTYFVGNDIKNTYKNASVISIVTDPDNLLSQETGIYRAGNYSNKGSDWERPAYVEYFDEDGSTPFSTIMGIRIHGGYSRHWGQKSFNLYFRDELGGLKNLKNYELIPGATNFDKTEATTKFKNFMLRNGGNDTEYTKLADVFLQSLVTDRDYTTQSSRRCVLFLNGEYWGLYNLTEKYSDNYAETEFGVDKKNVMMFKNGELDEGEDTDVSYYRELKALAYEDMTQDENYKKFTDMVDLQSYLDYFATEIYIGNKDWPNNNEQLWRTRTDDGTTYGDTKWRWMLFDTEFSMNLYGDGSASYDSIAKAMEDELFAAVMQNESFKKDFCNTMMDLYNVNFNVEKAEAKLDEMAELYRPLVKQYYYRFGMGGNTNNYSGDNMNSFDNNIARIKSFMENRGNVNNGNSMIGFLQQAGYFNAGATSNVTFYNTYADTMEVNTTTMAMENQKYEGVYFQKYSITVTAPQVEGREFKGFSVTGGTVISTDGNTSVIQLNSATSKVEATYE